MLVVKRKVIFITCLSLLLTSFQVTNNQSAVATTFCSGLGAAAYPPDLPDCLDPVVEEQRLADKAKAELASASAAASRAAADAAARQAIEQARLEKEAADAAAIRAEIDRAQAAAFSERISNNNLEAARVEAEKARKAAQDAKEDAKEAAEIANGLAITAATKKAAAAAAAEAALNAFNDSQARITAEIAAEKTRAENLRLAVIANKQALDDAERALADALTAAADASANATLAETAFRLAGGNPSLRMADTQSIPQSLKIKKEVLLTQTYPQSNLKIQNNTLPVFDISAECVGQSGELAAKCEAYVVAKGLATASAQTLAEKEAEKVAKENAWTTASTQRSAAIIAAANKTAELNDLESAKNQTAAAAAAAAAEATAAQSILDLKNAELAAATLQEQTWTDIVEAVDELDTNSLTYLETLEDLRSALDDQVDRSKAYADLQKADADAKDELARSEAAALRARQEADAAAALAARRPTESSPSGAVVSSAETIAAQEAEARARELEKKAQEAAKLAAEAKELAEKAEAEKQAADKAAAEAKAKADKAAADAKSKEEAKRNAAKKQIARDKAAAKKLLEESKKSAIDNAKEVDKSSQTINSAYEQALTEAAKANKALAKLKEKEKSALSALNLAKNELLTLDKVLDKADLEQKQAIAQYGSSQYKLTAIQTSIDTNEKLLVVVDKEIKNLQSNYNQLQTKYESLDKAAQSAATKAAESKKKSDAAYKELMEASNSKSLVANTSNLNLNTNLEENIERFNATSSLEKLRQLYQSALDQANKDKALAERALRDLQIAREAAVKAKQSLDLKITQRSKLKSELITLNSQLKVAKDELAVATSIKVKAVSAYTVAANDLAQKTNKLREVEINYQDAQSETKYEFENANSRDDQVFFLRKLSELSKSSVAAAQDVIESIDEEFKNLESSQALDLITKDVQIGFVSTSIPVILFTAASAIAIYAYLARRKRRSKFDLASDKTLARIREQQAAAAIKKKSVKVSKAKSTSTKKKPKSTK